MNDGENPWVKERENPQLLLSKFAFCNPSGCPETTGPITEILSAKSVYFKNQTGSDAVGKNAVAQLQKWGKFQLVDDPKQADLIFFLFRRPLQRRQHHLR